MTASYDVIVAGGGVAGVCAAVASVREGKKVLLIEKNIDLGGLATVGLISWFEPLCDGAHKQMVSGIGEELFKLAIDGGYDNLHPDWGGTSGNRTISTRYASFYSPTFFSLNLDVFVRENGVEILYDTLVTRPIMQGNKVTGIVAENIDGSVEYACKMLIDATGTATVIERVGIPTKAADNVQTLVLHDTDRDKAKEFAQSGDMTVLRHWEWLKSGEEQICGVTAEKENEYLARCKSTALKRFRGGNKNEREILALPQIPQIRVIRTAIGQTVFCATDDDKDKPVSDSIGSLGDFAHGGSRFDIPFGCIYNANFPNVLFAGRIVSAQGNGINILRVIPGCCITGQAAGVAASVALNNFGGRVSDKIYPELRNVLNKQGVRFAIR